MSRLHGGCSTPIVSVVVPVYNKAPHIRRALTSALHQSLQEFELIIVDDASTDGSLDIIKAFDDARIRVLSRSEPGPGGYAARNLGLQAARSRWVAFLDADDEWCEEHLRELYCLIERFPAAGLVGTNWIVQHGEDEGGPNPTRQRMIATSSISISFYDYVSASTRGLSPFWTSAVALSREVALRAGGFPAGRCRRGGDVDTWLRVIAESGCAAWSPAITAIYHRSAVNMVTRTEPFTAACERATVAAMLTEEKDPALVRELKRFANMRAISGYLRTLQMGMPVLNLTRILYLDVLNVKQAAILALSLLPPPLARRLCAAYFKPPP